MLLRLDAFVTRGEIDNTQRGVLRLALWLTGADEPFRLTLGGDAWADVAGRRVLFTAEPPAPPRGAPPALLAEPGGVLGDVTLSRGPDEVYVEWFDAAGQRCLFHGKCTSLAASQPLWSQTEDEEQAQKVANLAAMRDYLAGIIRRPDPGAPAADDPWSEDAWEEQLRLSDRLADASMEAHEKYDGVEGGGAAITFVMGWESQDVSDEPEADDEFTLAARAAEEEEAEEQELALLEELARGECPTARHPLVRQSRAFVQRLAAVMGDAGSPAAGSSALVELDDLVHLVNGKLSGVLGCCPETADVDEPGLALAVTRRCLSWCNEALGALAAVGKDVSSEAFEAELASIRADLLSLRGAITEVRQELRRLQLE